MENKLSESSYMILPNNKAEINRLIKYAQHIFSTCSFYTHSVFFFWPDFYTHSYIYENYSRMMNYFTHIHYKSKTRIAISKSFQRKKLVVSFRILRLNRDDAFPNLKILAFEEDYIVNYLIIGST